MGGATPRQVDIVNARWAARIFAAIILILFFILMADLQRRLVQLQRQRKPPATSTR